MVLMMLSLWMNYHSQQGLQRSLDEIGQQLDAREQSRIDMMEARIIVLEKKQAEIRAILKEN